MPAPTRRPCVVMLTAMQQELKPIVKKLSLREVPFGDTTVFAGAIQNVKVVATLTSMGTAAATATTERMVNGVVVDHVVVVGIAGGLHPDIPLGHVLVPEVVVDRYTDAEYRAAPLADLRPTGRLSTSDELDNSDEDIARLLGAGVGAVDMETASIAAVCERHGVPWSAFRAISDRVDDDTIDEALFNMANIDGSPNLPVIAKYVLTRPHRLPNLARLGRQMEAATDAAATAAIDACRAHDFVLLQRPAH